MRALSAAAQEIFDRAIEGLNSIGDAKKIGDGEGFMPLCVEIIGQPRPTQKIVSMAHYFEQNGDLCCDPDVEFLVATDGKAYPMVFKQAIPPLHQIVMEFREGSIFLNEAAQASLTTFCNDWMANVKEQQNL